MISFHTDHRLLLVVPVAVFAALSFTIAVYPAHEESHDADRVMSEEVRRGRAIYQREGCAVCHTQQVRQDTRQPRMGDGGFPPLAQDARYGRPSRRSDYAGEDPPYLGTQRTGPDLQNVGARLPSREWHLVHLFDPRLVSPQSVMPAYRWYFKTDGDPAKDHRVILPAAAAEVYGENFKIYDTPEARDLVAYLLSLKTEAPTR